MTITIWIEKKHLEDFRKFYDAVNQEKQIEKEDIPSIEFKTSQPKGGNYLQINVWYEIYEIMQLMIEDKSTK